MQEYKKPRQCLGFLLFPPHQFRGIVHHSPLRAKRDTQLSGTG